MVDLNQPLVRPPPGVKQNLENPPNEAALAYSSLAVALCTVTLFAWFRFLVKLYIVEKLHLEDYLIPFSWLAAIGYAACGFLINEFAPIIHTWDLSVRDFGKYLLWYRLGVVFYNISIVLIKVSMVIQVLRIFVPRGAQSKTYYICHILIWSNVVYYTVIVFLVLFGCQPLNRAWKPWLPGKCLDMGIVAMTTAAFNLVGDLAILFLTQRVIWKLMRVDRKQRVKLSIVFLAGIVPCCFAIMCLYYNSRMMRSIDFVRDSYFMGLACYGEISSGMFVLFLPVLPRFFTHIKEATSLSSFSHRRAPSALEFSDVNPAGGQSLPKFEARKHSMWHISYTQRNSEDRRAIMSPKKEDFGDTKSFGSRSETSIYSKSP